MRKRRSIRPTWFLLISVLGTTYRFHPLFVLLMLLSAATGYFIEMLTLFGIVLIHELGHVTAAKRFGWRVREVKLLPFGGVAEVDEGAGVPAMEELWVALAGPLQNVWMAGVAWAAASWGGGDPEWWRYFAEANVLIGLFNLLPIPPLDGGKILLAIMSYAVRYHVALVVCSWSGLAGSVIVMLYAIFPPTGGGLKLHLLTIGLFLFYSNWYGFRSLPFLFLRFLMAKRARNERGWASSALPKTIVVAGNRRVWEVMKLFMRERYHLVYICDRRGFIMNVLPEQRLLHAFFIDKKMDGVVSELIM
jgi:stage IV sporulation protein FB